MVGRHRLTFRTSLGLAAVVLAHSDNPIISLTSGEVSAGLPAVKGENHTAYLVSLLSVAAAALMGSSGATAMLILLFLAVTSACSAELIAVSNLLTYDVYGTYINRKPTEKQILWSSHVCILAYAIFMGAIATAFNYIGVSMGYLYELMGSIIGSAVVPVALCITWKKCNGTGAIVGAILGFAAAMAGWIGITAHLNNGVIDVNTTFGDYEMLTGNLLAIGVGGLVTVGWSLVRPENFDFDITRAINVQAVSTIDENMATPGIEAEKKDRNLGEPISVPGTPPIQDMEIAQMQSAEERAVLQKAFRFACMSALALTLILIFVSTFHRYSCVR